MTRVAAIDCGTNSIRLLIADVTGDVLTDVVRRMEIVRLGQDTDRTGRLAPEAIARTARVLADYARQARDLGVERVRMVATSATRDAANRAEFHDMVVATLGAEPEVISGAEEAALSFTGAVRGLARAVDTARLPYLVADIGGGSTELVLGRVSPILVDAGVDPRRRRSGRHALGADEVTASYSMDVGCVRLTERHLRADPPTADQVAAAEADILAALAVARAAVPVASAETFVGLAGSVTTVAAIALELPAYDPARIHHSRISAARVRDVTARLLAMTHADRAALPVMHPGRVDVIGAGALILRVLLDEVGADEVVVSEHDILDGIAWSLA